MKEVIFNNYDDYQDLKDKLIKGAKNKLHVIADFDQTLTSTFIKGRKAPSITAALRDGQYLSPDYSIKAQELFDYYHPIEIDSGISLTDKKKLMTEWYEKHYELMIVSGITQEKIALAIDNHLANLRPLVTNFLTLLNKENIPLLIFSAAGLGVSGLRYYLSQRGVLFDNISFIANDFIWDIDGHALGVNKPIIHSFNKDETTLMSLDTKTKIIDRPNILLLGDALADAKMSQGYPYQNILKIGFLNDKIRESLTDYNQVYDALILNDGDFGLVLNLLVEIVNDQN